MIESVMMDQEIKDDPQQGNTNDSATTTTTTHLVIPTETTTGIVVVVTSAEEEEDDDDGRRVEKSKETEFEVSVVDKLKANVVVVVEEESEPPPPPPPPPQTCCVIDVKCIGKLEEEEEEDDDVEKVCRICHLSADSTTPSENYSDMIQLGCGCKDELGIAHRHCAETWFKLKGNRCCEICGEAAKNITGMWDDRFMEDWNDRRSVGSNSLDRRWGFWRGQPFCNFLMACLVMAFVLPWFFRVNMF